MTSELRDREEILREVGTVRDVLDRHGFNSRRPTCPNPDHDDRKPGSVSILLNSRTRDPGGRLFCHACGISLDSIGLARLLGEHVQFTREISEPKKFNRRIIWRRYPPNRKQIQKRTRLRSELVGQVSEQDLVLAKKLARLGSQAMVRQEILRNWDFLSESYNLPLVFRMVEIVLDRGAELVGLPYDLRFAETYWNGDVQEGWVDQAITALTA